LVFGPRPGKVTCALDGRVHASPGEEEERPIAALAAPQAPPRATQRTDEELVAAVRRGDDVAFGVLFERYRRRLIAFAVGMVGDHGRAEDVTQEVFISALRRLRATDGPIAFKPWIYEIARNACIDTFRRSRRTDEVSLDVEEGPAAGVVARLANTAPGPVAALDDKERIADLRGAFGGLSDAERDALVLRELEGRSYREIGERLEMRRPAVESTLFRARRKLETEYDELRSGERCRRVQGIVAAAAADGSHGAGAPGARDARRLTRHVSHCQPCRRAALAAGMAVDPAQRRPLRSRVAGLLPLPAFLRPEGGGLASLAGHAEPAVAWAKALAAAATVTTVGLGAGVAVEEGAGVPLGAGGGQALIERATGQGPEEQGWGTGRAQGAEGTQGARAAGATGARDASGARTQGREGPGREASRRDGAASGNAAPGSGPRDAGSPATTPTAPGAGNPAGRGRLGAGREPTGLLSGGGPALPAPLDPGDAIRPGDLEGPRLDGLVPPPPAGLASTPTALPTATVQSASDTPQATATGASAPGAGLPSRAPEAP
jgi:RNA polymerase sigma factor (sigma-70 family)